MDEVRAFRRECPHLVNYTPATGEIHWEQTCRASVRSDSHQVSVQVAGEIEVCGSPARSAGLPHNVFGTDDLREAARSHLVAAQALLPFGLPSLDHWRITRLDVTFNYDLGSAAGVRQALAYLRQMDGGRYKVSSKSESIYWSSGSPLRSANAYHKGPHLRFQVGRGQAVATDTEISLADRLLRLELKLGSMWWRRYRQFSFNQFDACIHDEFINYFGRLIGPVEVMEMSDLERIKQVVETEGQALAVHRSWCVIRAVGHQSARESMPKRTWYRHVKILRLAGFSSVDISLGQVVPFRRRALVFERPVNAWSDMVA